MSDVSDIVADLCKSSGVLGLAADYIKSRKLHEDNMVEVLNSVDNSDVGVRICFSLIDEGIITADNMVEVLNSVDNGGVGERICFSLIVESIITADNMVEVLNLVSITALENLCYALIYEKKILKDNMVDVFKSFTDKGYAVGSETRAKYLSLGLINNKIITAKNMVSVLNSVGNGATAQGICLALREKKIITADNMMAVLNSINSVANRQAFVRSISHETIVAYIKNNTVDSLFKELQQICKHVPILGTSIDYDILIFLGIEKKTSDKRLTEILNRVERILAKPLDKNAINSADKNTIEAIKVAAKITAIQAGKIDDEQAADYHDAGQLIYKAQKHAKWYKPKGILGGFLVAAAVGLIIATLVFGAVPVAIGAAFSGAIVMTGIGLWLDNAHEKHQIDDRIKKLPLTKIHTREFQSTLPGVPHGNGKDDEDQDQATDDCGNGPGID